jgi:hypothetical protein
MTAVERLVAMFEVDLNDDTLFEFPEGGSILESRYYQRFKPYELHCELGADLSWPPLSEVWACQGECEDEWERGNPERLQRWAKAWALLTRLHEDYLAAKRRKAGE